MVKEKSYRALQVTESEEGFKQEVMELPLDGLPPGEVLLKVEYSSLNYKDALSATGNRGVTKKYPHTPGIDAAGTVVESAAPEIAPGTDAIVTGYDLGMNTPGGWGEYVRVPAGWVVPLPEGLGLRESMALGTAGLTAGLSVLKLLDHGATPADGEVLVTGATGGVGSLAVAVLAKLGFAVTALSGKPAAASLLRPLGARNVLPRDGIGTPPDRPLVSARFAHAVDTVGGEVLAHALKAIKYGGGVACCGMVASHELTTSVFPFILRGVSLFGIDSAQCPMETRVEVWRRFSGEWKLPVLDGITREIGLEDLEGAIQGMLAGKARGRTVVRVGGEG
jgi:putative YhdH/YhfP family quinone oxidoreductase